MFCYIYSDVYGVAISWLLWAGEIDLFTLTMTGEYGNEKGKIAFADSF